MRSLRRLPALLSVCALAFMLVGCSSSNTDTSSETDTSTDTSTETTTDSSAAVSGDTQTVGSDELGYVEIPADWVSFVDTEGVSGLQYSDTSGSTILTLDLFDLASVPEDERESFDVEAAAESVYANLSSNEVENLEGAQQTLAGRDALQLYGTYTFDDGTTGYIVCWLLEDDAGNIHYVCIEGPEDDFYDAFLLTEDSYQLP